jgi:hypothetical protein
VSIFIFPLEHVEEIFVLRYKIKPHRIFNDESFDGPAEWFLTAGRSIRSKDHTHCEEVHFFNHEFESSREISVDSWETEASCDISKGDIYLAIRVADSPIINVLE